MIQSALSQIGNAPLSEALVTDHIRPLFCRHLEAMGDKIYLATHSLGRPLDATAADVQEGLDKWYRLIDDAWGPWMEEVARFRNGVGRLIGASSDQIVPKSSVGQALRAVLNALPKDGELRPVKVVTTTKEFDSVDFILKSYEAKGRCEVTWIEPDDEGLISPQAIAESITDETDLVVYSRCFFETGQLLLDDDIIVNRARECDALVFVDAYHAVGVVPTSLANYDFMAGGSYKYTRGGPGACWLAINTTGLETLDTGWFAKADTFGYHRGKKEMRKSGGDGWLESTPAILPYSQARSGLELTLGLGVERIRDYGLRLNRSLVSAFQDSGLNVVEPADLTSFGAFVRVRSGDPHKEAAQLKSAGVNVDARGTTIRFGPDLLTTRAEIERAASTAAEILKR